MILTCFFMAGVASTLIALGNGMTRSKMFAHDCAHMFPRKQTMAWIGRLRKRKGREKQKQRVPQDPTWIFKGTNWLPRSGWYYCLGEWQLAPTFYKGYDSAHSPFPPPAERSVYVIQIFLLFAYCLVHLPLKLRCHIFWVLKALIIVKGQHPYY